MIDFVLFVCRADIEWGVWMDSWQNQKQREISHWREDKCGGDKLRMIVNQNNMHREITRINLN